MIVNLTRPNGDSVTLQPPIIFEGGEPQPGVLVTCTLDSREMTGRVIEISPHRPDEELVVTIEAVDSEALDIESEVALASLPPAETLNRQP
jgi:hypothetical protein